MVACVPRDLYKAPTFSPGVMPLPGVWTLTIITISAVIPVKDEAGNAGPLAR